MNTIIAYATVLVTIGFMCYFAYKLKKFTDTKPKNHHI
jgi:hypothetical protein